MITVTVTHHTSHPFSYLSSLPLVTDPITVALNDCARDRLHKDRCMQAFGRNTLSKPHSAKQLIWLWRFIRELGIDQSQLTSLCSDNLGAITLSQDATYHACTKHINIAYHFIREKVASHEAALTYVPTKDNIADIMIGR